MVSWMTAVSGESILPLKLSLKCHIMMMQSECNGKKMIKGEIIKSKESYRQCRMSYLHADVLCLPSGHDFMFTSTLLKAGGRLPAMREAKPSAVTSCQTGVEHFSWS